MSGHFDKYPWERAWLLVPIHKEPKPMQRFVVTAVDIAIDKMMESVYLRPNKE